MGILSRLTSMFSSGGRDDGLLLQGLEHAKKGQPEKAIEVYNTLLDGKTTRDMVRARALFNRALAHSALSNDQQAIADLQEVLTMPNLPENVQTAARSQLIRVRKRSEK